MCTYIYKHLHSVKCFTDCLIKCILSNWEVIKYHILVIEFSVICLNTGQEDRLNCWGAITLAQSTASAIPSRKLHLVCLDKLAKHDE